MRNTLKDKLVGLSNNMNCLRTICAILVIVCHSYAITADKEDFLYRYTVGQCNLGGLAVAIFFFLSGMYVTKSLYKENSAIKFIKKRCKRLFPQLWITVIVSILIGGFFLTNLSLKEYFINKKTYLYLLNGILIPIHDLPGVFTRGVYSTVNGPLWTMPVEFASYITLAVIQMMCTGIQDKDKNIKCQKILHIASEIGVLFIFLAVNFIIEKNGFLSTVVRPVIFFLAGTLYCDFADKIVLNIKIAVVFVGIVIISAFVGGFNIAIILLLPYIVVTFALGTKQLRSRGILYNISYEMYLVGWPIQQILFMISNEKMKPVINICLSIPIDIILAFLLYKFTQRLEDLHKARTRSLDNGKN